MCPFGTDTNPAKLLYGDESAIGLNIMRMEISPNFIGDVRVPEWGNWDSPYDWNGSLPSAKIVKQRGGIVFGTPWSPPGEYKTNGTARGRQDEGKAAGYEYSAYIKGDSVIVMAINTTERDTELKVKLPFSIKSGICLQSLGNEAANLCQEEVIAIDEPTKEIIVNMPYQSLNTYIFMIDHSTTAIEPVKTVKEETATGWHTLDGRSLSGKPTRKGLYIHNGKTVVVK